MKIFVFTLLFILMGNSLALSPQEIFTFEDRLNCNEKFPHYSFCEAVEVKPWRQEEITTVKKYLSQLNKTQLSKFYEIIKERGITKFHRVSYGSRWFTNSAKRRVEFTRIIDQGRIWVNPTTNVVGFADRFFSGQEIADPYSPLSKQALSIFHEIVHIYDIARKYVSLREDLKDAVGWYWDGNDYQIKGIEYTVAQTKLKTLISLLKTEKEQSSYVLMRNSGIEVGLPSLYSITNFQESFAELMTYYIFDPYAKEYIQKEVQVILQEIIEQPLSSI